MKPSADTIGALVRTDSSSFARKSFETVEGNPLSDDFYVLVVLYHLLRLHRSEVQRLIINLPLRHAKTLLAVIFTTWALAHNPTLKILVLSQLEELATIFVQHIRTIVQSSWFEKAFPLRLKKGQDRIGYFRTSAGGAVFARPLMAKLAGFGADLIVVDDPADPKDARNLDRLLEINEYVESLVFPRLNNPASGRILVIQHRIHALDLTGHLLATGDWEHLKLSLIADEPESHAWDGGVWHRQKGEALRPAEYSPSYIRSLQARASVPDFQTFFQQEPLENKLDITAEHFQTFEMVPPTVGGVVLSVDPALVEGDRSSFSVVQAWQASGSSHYLIDLWRAKVGPLELEQEIKRLIRRHRASVLLIEAAGFGVAIADRFAQKGNIRIVRAQPAGRSKIERLLAVREFFQNRRIFLPKAALWTASFIDELTRFPYSDFDDQVDAVSQYLSFATRNPTIPSKSKRCMGVLANSNGVFTADQLARHYPQTRKLVFSRR
jgi:predicted phage terminase large subunit-like protein